MHKDSLEDGVHHILYFILVFLKLQGEKHQVTDKTVCGHFINILIYSAVSKQAQH